MVSQLNSYCIQYVNNKQDIRQKQKENHLPAVESAEDEDGDGGRRGKKLAGPPPFLQDSWFSSPSDHRRKKGKVEGVGGTSFIRKALDIIGNNC